MRTLNTKRIIAPLLIVLIQFVFIPLPIANAYSNPSPVPLGTLDNFAVLAKTLISSPTGATVLNNGDLGIDSPGECTGFTSPCTGTINGTINNGAIQYQNAVALTGQTDATAAVTNIGLRVADNTLSAQLGGLTLTQGIYEVPAAATNLTGDLTLNGDADSIFIFHMTSSLITDSGSRVLLTGGVQACNVFWKVDSSATFNGTTEIVGTVLAQTSISFPGGGATLAGRAIAQTAAVTFNATTVNNPSCSSDSDSDSDSGSGFSSNNKCVDITPGEPQWVRVAAAQGGVNVTWSAEGGSRVDIEVTNSSGEYEYKYVKVENTGHMFLPNVTLSQSVRVRVLNECKYGGWTTASPSLPNTGFVPRANSFFQFFLKLIHLN